MENRKNIEVGKRINNPKSNNKNNIHKSNHSENSISNIKNNQDLDTEFKSDEDISHFTKNFDTITQRYKNHMVLLHELDYENYDLVLLKQYQDKIKEYIDEIVNSLKVLSKDKNISSKHTHIKELEKLKLNFTNLYKRYDAVINYKKVSLMESNLDKLLSISKRIENKVILNRDNNDTNIIDKDIKKVKNIFIETIKNNKFDSTEDIVDYLNHHTSINKNEHNHIIKLFEEYEKNIKNELIKVVNLRGV